MTDVYFAKKVCRLATVLSAGLVVLFGYWFFLTPHGYWQKKKDSLKDYRKEKLTPTEIRNNKMYLKDNCLYRWNHSLRNSWSLWHHLILLFREHLVWKLWTAILDITYGSAQICLNIYKIGSIWADWWQKKINFEPISYIQAFVDGNKRTARITSNAILIANGYCPISFRTVDSIDYKKAMLMFYEQNNIAAFKKIFIEQFLFAVKTYF